MSTADRLQPDTSEAAADTGPDKPEGPVVAAVLAGGIGCFVMGLFTTLSEASTSFADWLTFNEDVGPLSGKTIMTVVVWLAAWAVLHVVYRRRQADLGKALVVSLVLIGLGVVLTFPTFFQLFAPEE